MVNLSIIIPVYNSEKYVRKCINSVINQSYKDYELILVDDGSTDKGGQICDEYIRKNVKVIHKDNGGSNSARKVGIENCNGKYVTFIDSDDWIEENTYSAIFNKNHNDTIDIYVYGFLKDFENGESIRNNCLIKSGIYDLRLDNYIYQKSLINDVFYEPGIAPTLCCKIFKKSIIEPIINSVDMRIRMGEDALITYTAISKSSTICIINNHCPYHYCIRDNSVSTSNDPQYFEKTKLLISQLAHNIDNNIMLNYLDYYILFLIKIGLVMFLSKDNYFDYRNMASIKKIVNEFKIKEIYKSINKDKFNKCDKVFFTIIASKNGAVILLMLYIIRVHDKIKNKIKKVYN